MTHPADAMDQHPDESDRAFEHRKNLSVAAAITSPVNPDMLRWLQTGDPDLMPEGVQESLRPTPPESGGASDEDVAD